MDTFFVAPLEQVDRDDLAWAGGKGANLGELVKAGFSVPKGFVVTTDAYDLMLEQSGLGRTIATTLKKDPTAGAAIREAFLAACVPPEIEQEIVEVYRVLLSAGAVAVRSSATAEDLPEAAFAGQQDTFLNVVGERALLDAVRRCWASLWTDRALAYRRRRGMVQQTVKLAVVVQQMVPADTAGVLFTANPVTGARDEIVVDASPGLGEAVVSGQVTPDHFALRKRPWGWVVTERSPGKREVAIRALPGGGTEHLEGSAATDVLELSDRALRQLARLGAAIADHFGRPQDVEWAYAEGRLRLLQARPMTALPLPVRLNRWQRLTGSVLLELLPYRPYPIDMTTWVPHGPAGAMAKLGATFGIRGLFEDFLLEKDGVVYRLIPPSPHPTLGALKAPFRLTSRARHHDPSRWTEDPRFADFLRRVDELAGQDLAAMPWARLIRVPRQALDLVQPVTDLRIDYLPRTVLALVRLLVALGLLRRVSLLGDLILGAATRTEDANRALEELAKRVRENPLLKGAIDELDAERLKEFGDFRARFEAFLAEYGHRETATAILATSPTWGETPETVLGLIKMLAATAPSPASAGRADQALERLLAHPLLRGQRMRARLRRWVGAVRSAIAFREDSHFYVTMPLPILRRSLLEIGRRLCGAGVLAEPEEVFHLRLEELEAIADIRRLAEPDAQRMRTAVRTRSDRRKGLEGVPLINPSLIFPSRDKGTGALVSGIPASGGTATGPVCVIRQPSEFAKLSSGDILVCPYTNPAWTPLFQRAAAVVVDSGAIGSHAAIVAREYGIPAVMGTVEGTQKLMDGQLVTVDGSAGTVATQPLADGFPSDVTMPGESSGSPFPAHGPS
jgi:phosphohistidine swiveling domain-containing protein